MKTKREVLESVARVGSCKYIDCPDCPYNDIHCHDVFFRIGAIALLRMFRKKKKHTLSVGTKIKFDDGRIAEIVGELDKYLLEFSNYSYPISYLIGTTWEVVPSEVEDVN